MGNRYELAAIHRHGAMGEVRSLRAVPNCVPSNASQIPSPPFSKPGPFSRDVRKLKYFPIVSCRHDALQHIMPGGGGGGGGGVVAIML